MQTIKTTFKLEEKDFVKFQMLELAGSSLKIVYMCFILIVFCYLFVDYINTGRNFNFMALSAIAVAAYVASFVYFVPKNAKKAYKTSSYKNKEFEIEANDQGIRLNRGDGKESLIPWDSFHSVWNKWEYYLFYITQSNHIQVPERCFDQKGNEIMKALIMQYVKPSKRKNPQRRSMLKLSFIMLIAGVALFLILISFLMLFGIIK